VTRPQGSRCDIGAFEVLQATPAATTPPSPPVTGMAAMASINRGLAATVALMLVVVTALGAGLAVTRRRLLHR